MTEINVDYPDLINLSADEQEQRLQLLKVEAKMTASATKDSAKADGKDVNIIRTRFANMNEGSKPIALTYRITSGDAVFKENNLKSIRKNTNNTLSSTVELISTTPGRGTLTATPVLNPTMAPPPVDYEFVGLPRNLFLLFTVDTDNQHSDGIAVNVVTALLTDGGNPVANERIDFDLSGVAQFAGGGTRLSVTTDASGKITLRITSNANADIAVKLTGTVISTSALHAVTINFKKKPVGPVTPRVADFHLERLVPTGIANDRRPAQVRAVAVLDTDSAVTVLFIRFISKVVSITKGKMDLVTLVAPGQLSGARGTTGDRLDAIEFTRTTTPTGVSVRGTRDVWLYQMDREATSRLVSAELLDSNMRVIASSLVSTNQVVSFTADGPPPPPPPPPPPAASLLLTITPIADFVRTQNINGGGGVGNIALVRLTQGGRPVANANVSCTFNPPTGLGGFANDGNQRTQQVSPQGGNTVSNIVMRTNNNGEFSVTMAVWAHPGVSTRQVGTLSVSFNGARAARQFNWV